MSTPTPNDPFIQQPPAAFPGEVGAPLPPAPPLPGQTPPPGGYVNAGWAPQPPQGLAITTIALTGLYTLFTLISGVLAQTTLEDTKASLESGETTTNVATTALGGVSFLIGVGSFVVLALWMTRIRGNLKQRGITAGGPPAVEWWGWFVPLANFVLPLLGMKAIARGKASIGLLLGWWIPFCLMWLTSFAASAVTFLAIDFETGKLSNPDALDASVPMSYLSALFVIVSWVFLTVIIRRVTARHLED